MKLLFFPPIPRQHCRCEKKLSQAGIPCALRNKSASKDAFGIKPAPELFIKNERDIIKAFRLLGTRRLRQMTVIL